MTTYADGHRLLDADSHLMETHDWLERYADSATRDRLAELGLAPAGADAPAFIEAGIERMQDATATLALEDNVISSAKGWMALGAMSSTERVRALDLLGIEAQLVFTTFAGSQFLTAKDPDARYGGASAHNRGITDFCSIDDRLLAVGMIPLDDPERALAALDEALELGCGAIWVPHLPAGDRSPAHVVLDPFWARLAEAGIPFVLHVGGGGRILRRQYHDNGRPKPRDFIGGGENLRAKDFTAVHHDAETFLACIVLDGVFERHEDLRCGVIELGATWVPGLLRRLDAAKASFGRHEPMLAELSLDPADYLRRQVRFTPFCFEDVGELIEQSDPELYLFSTDYPHPEGGRDPLGRFDSSLDSHGIAAGDREKFFVDNFLSLFGESSRRWPTPEQTVPKSAEAQATA